jgi:MYXO-CTERM domain-containing protein
VPGQGVVDRAVTTGGRGGCQTSPEPGAGSWLLVVLVLGVALARRRRARALSVLPLLALFPLAAGCEVTDYHYQTGDPGHYRFPDAGPPTDAQGLDVEAVDACVATPEACDGEDNDCNGVIDDVAQATLDVDPQNCGACGWRCEVDFAFPGCAAGECTVGTCFPGHHDLNGIPDDGCEYACSPTNGGIERCDGMDNDCNGLADETIDLDTDATNCGECGHVCMFYQATGACSGGQCELFSCRGGFVDRDGNGDNGCECQMTLTEGSVTCDPAAPACGAAEVCADVDGDAQSHCSAIPLDLCDGEDNDCDGQVDEDAETQLSDSACYTYPLGCSETAPGVWSCAGQCRTGLEQCVGGRIRCSGEVTPSAEVCDGVDNNCDGQVDEGYDVQSDLRNCGTCGNVCPLQAGANSYAVACAAGQCQFACQPNHHDLDGDVATGSAGTGCEYACIRSNGGVEACGDSQDNDCDGQVDEGFLLATDPNNCGTCGNSCAAGTPIHAVAQGCSGGTCQYSCEVGWNDTNGDRPLGLAGNGCEYACTPSNGGVEACDDLDNDCDGQIDEDFFKETNPLNCGACGYQCSAHLGAHAVVLGCSGGVCRFGCAAGWVDLNGDVALGSNGNGCEYACTPSNGGVEICDTLDNDCDGKTDEGADGAPLAQTCYSGAAGTAGVGTCRSGARLCTGGAYGACLGEVVPQAELCDGLDNDCNGQVDNGISTASDINNCGACGQSCWASLGANAYPSACVAGVCQLSCLPGFSDLNNDRALGTGGDGCEYTCPVYPPTTEYCDGRDNDCDGQIDEGVTPPPGICYAGVDGPGPAAPGTAANNPCRNVTALCQDPDGAGPQPHAWYCQYPAAVERDPANPNALRGYELLCDGQDGDCDGTPDDGFGVGQSCDDGEIGACRSTGHFQCKADHLGSECHLEVAGADPANEQCDGLDNDCDGLVDESQLENVPGNEPAGITQGFVVDEVVDITTPGGLVVSVYLYEASHPTATATDGGIGTQSRSCSRPDVIPWSFVTYQQAARACALAGRRLCRPAEWYEACNGTPGSSLYPYGNTYQPASCNGHDADAAKDAVEPTGWQSDCASNGWDIEDLSGNLREWTTDFVGVTVDGRKVFRLRGGSYLDLQAGLACDFGNSAYVEDSAAAHVGFRCCSTCGNGTVDPGELCDPALTPATCHPLHCGPLTCGNGVREGSEQCDDGNLEPADGCSPACLTEVYCGDGVKATSEQCDDGNGTPFDGCSPLCTNETIVQPTVNFQTCPPTGWTIVNEGGTIVWDCQNNGNENGTGSPSGQKYIRAYSSGTATARTALVTSAYNFSTRTAVRLSFYYYYNESPVPSAPRGLLQYSTNGTAGPWTTIETIADPITAARWVKDVSAYVAGHASVAFRFYFEDLSTTDGASGLFQIDDVEIRAY